MQFIHPEAEQHMRAMFVEGLLSKPFKQFKTIEQVAAYFDGITWPVNPCGHTGYGWFVQGYKKGYGYVGVGAGMTNNVAEASGLIALMRELIRLGLNGKDVVIYGDSKLVIDRMNRDNMDKCSGFFFPYVRLALEIKKSFVNLRFKWLPRELNTVADQQSKLSVQGKPWPTGEK